MRSRQRLQPASNRLIGGNTPCNHQRGEVLARFQSAAGAVDQTVDHRLLEACSNIFRCPLAGLLCTHNRAFQACEGEVRIAFATLGPWQWPRLRDARRRCSLPGRPAGIPKASSFGGPVTRFARGMSNGCRPEAIAAHALDPQNLTKTPTPNGKPS